MRRASLMLVLYAGEVVAHPDHGAGGWLSATLAHLLSEPDHITVILAPFIIGLGWLARRALAQRARESRRS